MGGCFVGATCTIVTNAAIRPTPRWRNTLSTQGISANIVPLTAVSSTSSSCGASAGGAIPGGGGGDRGASTPGICGRGSDASPCGTVTFFSQWGHLTTWPGCASTLSSLPHCSQRKSTVAIAGLLFGPNGYCNITGLGLPFNASSGRRIYTFRGSSEQSVSSWRPSDRRASARTGTCRRPRGASS